MPTHRHANPSYDVIILGARRPERPPPAHLLARCGLRVLLDRGRYGTDALSTHAPMRGGGLCCVDRAPVASGRLSG